MNTIFIPGNVASSKNSKQWTGKHLIWSKVAQRYRTNTAMYWKIHRKDFLKMIDGKPKPIQVGFHFVRDSKRKFDFVNVVQTCQDLMVDHAWLPDDNLDEMLPFPMMSAEAWYTIDKKNPGVYIKVH